MAEQYLAGWPTVPCEGCDKPTNLVRQKLCGPCWNLRQILEGHAARLLADPVTAARARALLEKALAPKPAEPEPPKVA